MHGGATSHRTGWRGRTAAPSPAGNARARTLADHLSCKLDHRRQSSGPPRWPSEPWPHRRPNPPAAGFQRPRVCRGNLPMRRETTRLARWRFRGCRPSSACRGGAGNGTSLHREDTGRLNSTPHHVNLAAQAALLHGPSCSGDALLGGSLSVARPDPVGAAIRRPLGQKPGQRRQGEGPRPPQPATARRAPASGAPGPDPGGSAGASFTRGSVPTECAAPNRRPNDRATPSSNGSDVHHHW